MCLSLSKAPERLLQYGISQVKCGSCPECLQERSNSWVLRCVAEARTRRARGQGVVMVTLTYDQYLRDEHGDNVYDANGVPLELPPDVTKLCSKRDVQLFIKRLRKKFGANIKYLASAEHGARTHRAHYHALLFGVSFSDLLPYKKSNRGNLIYRSHTLERLWKHGICTVDSVNPLGAMARYVTKYSLKSRGSFDTFQLFSRDIGMEYLMANFTGKPYILEGREYAVPRVVWQRYIMSKYGAEFPRMSTRYIKRGNPLYGEYVERRALYSAVRNSDPVYVDYLLSQMRRAKVNEFSRPCAAARVAALPNQAYWYKRVWNARLRVGAYELDPNSSKKRIDNFYNRFFTRRHNKGVICRIMTSSHGR